MSEKILSRSFNHFKVSKCGCKITKFSSNTKKLINEINWFLLLPDSLKDYIPKIYSYDNGTKPYIEMAYFPNCSFDQIYLKQTLSSQQINQFFELICVFLNKARLFSKKQVANKTIKEAFSDIYLKKTIDRLNDLEKNHRFSQYFQNDIVINNKKYHSLAFYRDRLTAMLNKYDILEPIDLCLVHGDLCFNNILITDNQLKLIDPRGDFGGPSIYGDWRYEYAKLLHSISGYDQIINDLYDCQQTKQAITYRFYSNVNKDQFLKAYKKCLLDKLDQNCQIQIHIIEGLLFLSMMPLHNENFSHQIMMMALALEKLDPFFQDL